MKQKIYETGMKEIRNANFSGNLEVEEKFRQDCSYKAYTEMQTKNIYFGYDPRIIEKKGETSLLEVSSDVTAHEIDHHKYGKNCIGCPQSVEKDTDLFFEPMFKILKEKGFSKEDVNYATNALQDSILHRDLRKNEKRDLDGIVTFFEDVGEHNEKFTNFYEAHVKLNMDLWGTKEQKKKLNQFYVNNKKVKEVLNGFYSDLNEGKFVINDFEYSNEKLKEKLGEKAIIGFHTYARSRCKIKKTLFGKTKREWTNRKEDEKIIFDKEAIRNYVLNENNWKEISEIYAKHFSKLMTPNYAMPTPDHRGAGTKGRENEDTSEEGNPFKQERESRNFKKGRIMKSNKEGKTFPEWIQQMEALDILYEGLAEQIEIKAESYTNPETFPISWYGEREFNPEKDDLKHIKFGFNEEGELVLRKKRYSVDVPINVKSSPKSFPKIKFGMVDVSTSMKEDINGGENIGNTSIIEWGDNSKYHWALMTQFGIFEYFKKNHLLTQNSISAATFGSETKVVEGYQNVKEHLLKPSFQGSTNINLDRVREFFEGEGNLVYTIGDGEIHNWSTIKKNFIELAKKHSYAHLHMGTKNSMTDDLKEAGLEVIIAEDEKGIVNKVINLTDKIFRK